MQAPVPDKCHWQTLCIKCNGDVLYAKRRIVIVMFNINRNLVVMFYQRLDSHIASYFDTKFTLLLANISMFIGVKFQANEKVQVGGAIRKGGGKKT